ncbi:hypothetical protein [Phnomibacter ginsenosidimutans]|uniref:Uncharacterized protein n=1 Tax=Phnomibacter ginsenosidimutans TaxID=2676868 RepID=A0A6I6G6T0_9BACT|nr:hypothetical protein [Phnomibacter ginsenosidimutans]QGW28037.1 hypothetical protein GLV81_07945 [Phnomibacter ginsenosidimutans]
MNLIYNGHYKVKLCPVVNEAGEYSKSALHFRTGPLLTSMLPPYNKLEVGQTLTSNNNQFQCTITPDKRFIISQITIATRENGEKYIASKKEIWNKECTEGLLEIKNASIQPNCFKKEVPAADPTNPQRLPYASKSRAWKLENDGTIKWYDFEGNSFVTCNPN